MTRTVSILAVAVLMVTAGIGAKEKKGTFDGTWCVSEEGLVISFQSKDSLTVSSLRDESIAGSGSYELSDTLLSAKVESEDLTIEMGYRYKWQDESTVKARILYFTVAGDSVNHPVKWLSMTRCDPEKGIIPDAEVDDEE